MGGCEEYRVAIPFREIRERVPGSVLDWAPIGKVQKWAGDGTRRVTPTDYDMWVLPRHRPLPYGTGGTIGLDDIPDNIKNGMEQKWGFTLEGQAHLLDLVRLVKKKLVVIGEYDDDHWGSRDLGYMEHVDLARKLLREFDAITVTTEHMRDVVKRYAPAVPVYILPNCVKWSHWQGWDRWDRWEPDSLVLGLTGSITHYDDWIVLKDVIPRVLAEYPNVCLLLQGFVPDYFEELAEKYPNRVYADKGFRDYAEYPGVIRQSDITLCPVDPTDKFNLCKSPIKSLEGMSAGRAISDGNQGGAAVIASHINYYGRVVGWGNKRGIVVDHEPDAWYNAITTLIRDKEKRERYQRAGHRWAEQNLSIERNWKRWWDCYQTVYDRRKRL